VHLRIVFSRTLFLVARTRCETRSIFCDTITALWTLIFNWMNGQSHQTAIKLDATNCVQAVSLLQHNPVLHCIQFRYTKLYRYSSSYPILRSSLLPHQCARLSTSLLVDKNCSIHIRITDFSVCYNYYK